MQIWHHKDRNESSKSAIWNEFSESALKHRKGTKFDAKKCRFNAHFSWVIASDLNLIIINFDIVIFIQICCDFELE